MDTNKAKRRSKKTKKEKMIYREPGKQSWTEPSYNIKPNNNSIGIIIIIDNYYYYYYYHWCFHYYHYSTYCRTLLVDTIIIIIVFIIVIDINISFPVQILKVKKYFRKFSKIFINENTLELFFKIKKNDSAQIIEKILNLMFIYVC